MHVILRPVARAGFVLLALVILLLVSTSLPAFAAESSGGGGGFELSLDSWPVLVAGGLGVVATHLTELLTHYTAPQWIKSGLNLSLVTLAGVIATTQTVPGHTWKDYAGTILAAWATSMFAHRAGLTAWLQSITAGFGIGKDEPPLVADPVPPGDTS